jgi:hypothetical protein
LVVPQADGLNPYQLESLELKNVAKLPATAVTTKMDLEADVDHLAR